MNKCSVIIPTYNGGHFLHDVLKLLTKALPPKQVLIIDSGSTDETLSICQSYDVQLLTIPKGTFNHGGTRNLARAHADSEILIYMTQDAVPVNTDFLKPMLAVFENPQVALCYGRQLPRQNSSPLEAFPRLFNYPNHSSIKSKADFPILGIKTSFCSNSFCAYRASMWDEVGGFPSRTLTWEDQHIAFRLLQAGYLLAYCAESQVYHSHFYLLEDEFKRYFDAGAFLGYESWILKAAGRAESEGFRFLYKQLSYLVEQNHLHLLPYAFLATLAKYLGYRLGLLAPHIPNSWKAALSQQSYFWK